MKVSDIIKVLERDADDARLFISYVVDNPSYVIDNAANTTNGEKLLGVGVYWKKLMAYEAAIKALRGMDGGDQ